MQTFLPYPDFVKSAQCLDDKRLGKQRVECLQILKALTIPNYGWKNHPIVKMWKGYEFRLAEYGLEVCEEYRNRGFINKTVDIDILFYYDKYLSLVDNPYPIWLGNEQFHLSHQSNLIRKLPGHYILIFGNVPNNLPYEWYNPAIRIFYHTNNKKKDII